MSKYVYMLEEIDGFTLFDMRGNKLEIEGFNVTSEEFKELIIKKEFVSKFKETFKTDSNIIGIVKLTHSDYYHIREDIIAESVLTIEDGKIYSNEGEVSRRYKLVDRLEDI